MVQRIHYEYRRPGKGVTKFDQVLVLDRPDVKVLLLEQYDGEPLTAGDRVILEPSAPVLWYVFPEKWHDIGRFHLADGTLTGWYTNLTTPVEMGGEVWRASDLFLDLWQPADGGPAIWLDEDELNEAVREKVVDPPTGRRIENERAMLQLQVKMRQWPPPVTKDIDLAQARRILGM